jgi:hypothetical protein
MAERDSDLKSALKLDSTSFSDFTDLETRTDSRIRRVASSNLSNKVIESFGSKPRNWIENIGNGKEMEIDVNGLEWNLLVLIRERKREIC